MIPTFKETESIASLLLEIRRHVPDAYLAVVDDSPDSA
ncbi:polyprenol monophosphomannose synthase, partial [bacterium]|nr:polyprenol monophosphomannose synthase [bacterium]